MNRGREVKQLTPDNIFEVQSWCKGLFSNTTAPTTEWRLVLKIDGSWAYANIGDFIEKTSKGFVVHTHDEMKKAILEAIK